MEGQETGGRESGSPSNVQGGPDWCAVAWARAERTRNMYSMLVTLDVSKLSGWLNAAMFCRVQREAC